MAAVALSEVLSAKSIICDIEGTTTSISFVKDTLFPYALKNVENYLKDNWNEEATKTVVVALREQAEEDKKAEVEGVVPIPAGDSDDIIPDVVKNVEWQMSQDRKTGSLKTLQGLVWAKGYKDGTIKGHVYDDVQKSFEKWAESGRKIFIYSSGSVDAQKLLFENSEQGNLLKYLTGHYDTKIGAKREKESYQSILKNIETKPEEALFLTDVFAEAKAAKEAGLHVVLLDRPGNIELSEEERLEFPVISTFTDLSFVETKEENGSTVNGKRKIEETAEPTETDPSQEPPSKVVKVDVGKENATSNGAEEEKKGMAEGESGKVDTVIASEQQDEEMEVDGGKIGETNSPSDDKKNTVEAGQKEDNEKVDSDTLEIKTQDEAKTSHEKMEANEGTVAEMIVDDQEITATEKENGKESQEVKASETMDKGNVSKELNEKVEKNKGEDSESKKTEVAVKQMVEDSKTEEEKSKVINDTEKESTIQTVKPEAEKIELTVSPESKSSDKSENENKAKDKEDMINPDTTSVEVATGEETKPNDAVDEVATEVKADGEPEKIQEPEQEDMTTNDNVAEVASDKVATSNSTNGVDAETKSADASNEDKPATNGSSVGDEEKNADSDKENDTSTTNCEVDEMSTVVEKTNGSSVADSTESSVPESTATTEAKPKKVVDVVAPAVTPAKSIEAES